MSDSRGNTRAPDVVMILLDDLGFAEFGCYGSEIATPNVDALSEQGLRYNNFHVTALCSPTRACLLTGRNHHAVGMGFLPDMPLMLPGYSGRIPRSAAILPRVLREAGYATFMVGKWHLTPSHDRTAAGPFDCWPLGMGFERFYGFLGSATSQWAPDLVCDNGFVEPPSSIEDGYHLTEDLASQAIRFVQDAQQAAPDKPFFLYFATGAMHSPHQAPSAWIDPYRGRFDDGWEALRERTFSRQVELGVVPAATMLTERPPWVAAWDASTREERRVFARQMEVYAGFLSHTDAQIGRLLAFLAEGGVLENTIVLVLSDNGASAEAGPHGVLRHDVRDIESMHARIDEFGGVRSFANRSWGWAWSGNTPFRLWKRYSWLGGVRVPLIVHWPGGIAAGSNGHVRSQFCHAIDLMPTILEAAGVEMPQTIDGIPQRPLDGASLLATFSDGSTPNPRVTQYFETLGSRAIYHDGWKATTDHIDSTVPAERELIPGSQDFDSDQWSLYCLDDDYNETQDRADAEPERLRRLIELWWLEAGRNQVLPLMDGMVSKQRDTMLAPPPYPTTRHESVYRPGAGPIITSPPFAACFRVIAEVEVADDQLPSGIIVAHRDSYSSAYPQGWVCYVRDGHLSVSLNSFGLPLQTIGGEAHLAGKHEIEVTFTRLDDGRASIAVALDGAELDAADIPAARSGWIPQGRLMIGCDYGCPICNDYQPPFRFSGTIHRVVYTTPAPAGPTSLRDELENVLASD